MAQWESERYNTKHPFQRSKRLLDIMNVPLKTGSATLKVIEQQAERVGVYRPDFASGCGDGGGENEGTCGIHSLLTASNPTYLKRRCIPHFAWCTFKAGLNDMEPHGSHTVALNSYLRQGVTWSRLASIAVQPIAAGGLGLFTEGSRDFKAIFRSQPPRLIDERPEATVLWYEWLIPKQNVLAKLIACDLRSRNLQGTDGARGLKTLQTTRDCLCRSIDLVLMKKSMFLFYYVKKKLYIAENTSFDALVKRAVDQLTSTRVTDDVAATLEFSVDELAAIGLHNETECHWVEVIVCTHPGMSRAECDQWLPDMMNYHQTVCLSMASHLRATAENMRRHYMPGGMLALDPKTAREAGRLYHAHLLRQSEQTQTEFEAAFLRDNINMTQLGLFCDHDPPILLHKGNGMFADLFRFMAIRFLCCPDSVLDSESVHALWKWIEGSKRGLSFKVLNGLLKLQVYLRDHDAFPEPNVLNPYLITAGSAMFHQYATMRDNPALTTGFYTRQLYADRFNLRAADLDLIKQTLVRENAPSEQTPAEALSNYVRFLFEANHFYALCGINGVDQPTYFLIARSRTAPGKEAAREGEPQGRSLALAWYQQYDEDIDGIHVKPVVDRLGELHITQTTVAEISLASGYFPHLTPDDDAQAAETKHVDAFLNHEPTHFDSVRNFTADQPWGFTLTNPTNVEDCVFAKRSVKDLTKFALARRLQILHGGSDELRNTRWILNKDCLLAALVHGGDVGGVPAAIAHAVAIGKAKAKAKAAVKAAAKPVAKPAAKPKAKPAAKPVAKPAAKPKAKPAAKPAAKPKAAGG